MEILKHNNPFLSFHCTLFSIQIYCKCDLKDGEFYLSEILMCEFKKIILKTCSDIFEVEFLKITIFEDNIFIIKISWRSSLEKPRNRTDSGMTTMRGKG